MGLTVSLTGDWLASIGNKRSVNGTITFDSNYPTGGEALSAAQIGLGVIQFVEFDQGLSGYIVAYNSATGKVQVFDSASGASGTVDASHAHDLLIKGGQASATSNVTAHYATDIFGKEAATDATIAGDDSATKGGVIEADLSDLAVTVTGGSTAEVSNGTNLSTLTVSFYATGF